MVQRTTLCDKMLSKHQPQINNDTFFYGINNSTQVVFFLYWSLIVNGKWASFVLHFSKKCEYQSAVHINTNTITQGGGCHARHARKFSIWKEKL